MNIAAIQNEWIGRVIDARFPLVQWIGGSESAGVFLTEIVEQPWRKAAIKLVVVNESEAKAQLAVWARTSALSHPHLLPLLQTGRCRLDNATLVYSVTDYSDEVLSQILPERPLSPQEAAEMLGPLTDALWYLHGHGFLHGRLKPSNILVVEDRLMLSTDSLQVAGEQVVRAAPLSVYDAPELATGAISRESDVWSLGITLVESLTQHPPVWDRSSSEDPVVPPSLPPPFFDIAWECLCSGPGGRCTIGDIKARLAQPSSSIEKVGPVPTALAVLDNVVATPHRNWGRPVLIAAALVLIAIVALLAFRHHQAQTGAAASEKPAIEQPERAEQPERPEQPEPAEATPAIRKPSAGTLANAAPAAPAPIAASGAGAQSSSGATVKGEVPGQVMPDVLPSANASIRGQVNVAVRVDVDSAGKVTGTTLDSPGPSKYFAKVALDSAKQWRFKPARVNGNAVASIWTLHYQFTQGKTDVTPVETYP